MSWQHSGEALRKYDFTYDRLNRLLHARMPGAAFEERSITYDNNGNIRMLTRTENGIVIDSMRYSYMGNRLHNVRDYALTPGVNDFRDNGNTGTGQEYSYDANGSMNADLNKGIISISHNLLNQPLVINLIGGKRLEYVYTASGVKLRRRTFNGAVKDSTDYINGMQYEGGILDMYPHAEGYVKINPNNTFQYNYTLKDHLGNTRVVLAQDGTVLQRNNYYPFGKSIDAWDYSGPGSAYKYNYNGKESQIALGLNWNNYGARYYDPQLGRWHVVDPITESQENFSPYNYVSNNSVKNLDPDGRFPILGLLAGAGIGALVGSGIEIASQLYNNGSVDNWSAVGGAALQGTITGAAAGLTGGASLLTTAAVSGGANVIGGAANRAVQGQETTVANVVTDATVGVALGAAGKLVGNAVSSGTNNLSNSAKGKLGEAVTAIKYGAQGYKSAGKTEVLTGGRTATGKPAKAIYDHGMTNIFTGKKLTVESKFNGSTLTPNQAAAQSRVTTPGGLIIDKTTSQGLGNNAKAVTVGTGAGIDSQRNKQP